MESISLASAEADEQRPDAPLLLTAERVAERLDISIRTLWRLRAAGKLPAPLRLGGSIRWRPADIEAWIAAGCPQVSR